MEGIEPNYEIVTKSEYLLKAWKDVIQLWSHIFWNLESLEAYVIIFTSVIHLIFMEVNNPCTSGP